MRRRVEPRPRMPAATTAAAAGAAIQGATVTRPSVAIARSPPPAAAASAPPPAIPSSTAATRRADPRIASTPMPHSMATRPTTTPSGTSSIPVVVWVSATATSPTVRVSRCSTHVAASAPANTIAAATPTTGAAALSRLGIESLGRADRRQQRHRLVAALLVLARRLAVGDNTGARLNVGLAVPQHQRADGDAQIQVTGKGEI